MPNRLDEKNRKAKIFLFYLALICGSCFSEQGISSTSTSDLDGSSHYFDEDEFILAVLFNGEYLSQGILVKEKRGESYFPLGELFSLLKFPLFVSPKEGRIDGWFVDPSRSLEFDVNSKTIKISGEQKTYTEGVVEADEFDLYATKNTIQDWFPILLEVDEVSQVLVISSTEELPLERAKKRSLLQERLSSETVTFRSRFESQVPDYKFVDWPTVAVQLDSNYASSGGAELAYGLQLYGDFLGLNGKMSLKGRVDEKLSSAYLSLGRKDPSRRMFGPLGIAQFELGDIGLSLPSLIGGGVSGRGFKLSNRPLTRRYDVNKTTLEGMLKEQYDAELYVNSRLTDIFRSDGSGRYLFDDVELSLGANEIRIVFYGPNGEEEVSTESVFVGEKVNSLGEVYFDLVLMGRGRSVFEEYIGDQIASEENGITSAINFSIGIGKGFAMSSSLLSAQEGDPYIQASIEKRFNDIHSIFSIAKDQENDTAYSMSLFSRDLLYNNSFGMSYKIAGFNSLGQLEKSYPKDLWSINYSKSKSFDFNSKKNPSAWNMNLSLSGIPSSVEDVNVSASYEKYIHGINAVINNRIGRDVSEDMNTSGGSVRLRSISSGRGRLSKSFDLSYNILPDFEVVEAKFNASIRDIRNFSVRGGLAYDAIEGDTHYSVGAQRKFRNYNFDTGAFYRSNGGYGFRLGVEFSLAKHPSYALPVLAPPGSASSSRAAVLTFIDRNANGRRDDGELRLENIGLLRNGLPIGVQTDSHGYAVIDKLINSAPYDITIMPSTVLNPNLRTVDPDFAVVSRPGRLPIVELALIPTGDVEGNVIFMSKNMGTGMPNVKVLIRRISTGAVTEVFSQFDGLYSMSGLAVGSYELELDASYLSSIGLVSNPKKLLLNLSEGNDYWSEMDFVLSRE